MEDILHLNGTARPSAAGTFQKLYSKKRRADVILYSITLSLFSLMGSAITFLVQMTFLYFSQDAGGDFAWVSGPFALTVALIIAFGVGWKYFKEYSKKTESKIDALQLKYETAQAETIEEQKATILSQRQEIERLTRLLSDQGQGANKGT